jgi:hypothetical protein
VCVFPVCGCTLSPGITLSPPQALPGRVPPHAATIASLPAGKGSVASTGLAQGCLGFDFTRARASLQPVPSATSAPWCSLRFVSERRAVPSLSLSLSPSGPEAHHGRWDERGQTGEPQHHSPLFLLQLQGLLTLFAESFASFNRSTCALSVPCWYSALQGIHLALQTAVPSHSTPGCRQQRLQQPPTHSFVGDSIPLW